MSEGIPLCVISTGASAEWRDLIVSGSNESRVRFPRNLNRRDSTLWRSLVSVEFTTDEISATGSRQWFIHFALWAPVEMTITRIVIAFGL